MKRWIGIERNEIERERERENEPAIIIKVGKYKYAIFINECVLQCQCTHNVYVVYYFELWLFTEKKTFVIYAPKAQIHRSEER